jgi:hypothetical protein
LRSRIRLCLASEGEQGDQMRRGEFQVPSDKLIEAEKAEIGNRK